MKTIISILVLLSLTLVVACVGVEPEPEPDEAAALAPDAGTADLTLPIKKEPAWPRNPIPTNPTPIDAAPAPSPSLAAIAPDAGVDEGRKGGETMPCNCDDD